MGIAVAAEMQDGLAGGVDARLALDPDLADAAAHLVGVVVRLVAQRLQRAAELDDIAIAILPIVEEGEIVAYRVDRAQRGLAGFIVEAVYSEEAAPGASLFTLASAAAVPARVAGPARVERGRSRSACRSRTGGAAPAGTSRLAKRFSVAPDATACNRAQSAAGAPPQAVAGPPRQDCSAFAAYGQRDETATGVVAGASEGTSSGIAL